MTALDTAKAVLAKASLYDGTIPKPDLGVAVAWSEALADIDRDDALAAVTRHYAQPGADRIVPGDIIGHVRAIRVERIHAAGNAEPDYDRDDVAGGLAAIRAQRKAIADGSLTPTPITGQPPRELAELADRTASAMRRRVLRGASS